MKRFKNILVVVDKPTKDAENNAIMQAIALAKRNQAKLTLIDVIKTPVHMSNNYHGIINPDELDDMLLKRRETELNNIVASIQAENIVARSKVVIGANFIEIIRQVLREEHDLIIKTASEQTKGFASGDFHLMCKCPCPVWLLKKDQKDLGQTILAAVDLAQEDTEEGRQLNQLIMDLATSLTHWKNASLHLLSCWTLYGESSLRHWMFLKISENDLNEMLNAEYAEYQKRQHKLCNPGSDIAFEKHLIKGKPNKIIPEFVKHHAIDTVVMSTVGRTGVSGLLIGNTAETVLQAINSSVITVKPFGFHSPVS